MTAEVSPHAALTVELAARAEQMAEIDGRRADLGAAVSRFRPELAEFVAA